MSSEEQEDSDGLGAFFEIIGRPKPMHPPNPVPQLRLARLIKKGNDPDYLSKKLCYWCKKNKMVKKAWCPRCHFYMDHQFDRQMFIGDEDLNEWEEYKQF